MAYDDKDADEELSADERAEKVRTSWREAKEALAEWRNEARRCYSFVAGDQWMPEDKAAMEKDERPALSFNRMGAMVDSICGIEINNRQEVSYYPRTIDDVRPNEIYTEAAQWARDNCYAEDEESDSFRDAAICGIGVTETLMDYETNLDGDLKIVRRDPLKCAWSPYAQQKCLEDTKEVYYYDYMDRNEAENRWGVDVLYSDDPADTTIQHQADRTIVYDEDSWPDDKLRNQVLILHYQCYKLEEIYRALDPFTQKEARYDADGFKQIQEKVKTLGMEFSENPKGPTQIRYLKQKQRVYYRGFYCGGKELEWGKLPVQDGRGFTFRFITAKRDHVKKMWYGVVRSMIDPQQWGNKFLSLTVDIMARNAKGGLMVEEMALKDPKKAEENWAKPSSFIVFNEGGLEKHKERQQAQYPAGWDRLMNFSFESLHWVSGMNPEVMGMQDRAQSGVLEDTRKRSVMAILAPLFDSLKRYRKSQGYLLLAYIRRFLMDGRLIRITGKESDIKYIPLLKQEDTAEYDVVVDDAPTSPDFRDKVWKGLQPLIPALVKQGVPIPASVIQYAPGISSDVAAELQNAMARVPDPRIREQMEKMKQIISRQHEENSSLKEQNAQLSIDKSIEFFEMQRKHASEVNKLISKMQQNDMDNQTERAVALLQAHVDRINTILETETKDRKTFLDNFTKLQIANAQVKSAPAESDGGGNGKVHQVLVDVSERDSTNEVVDALKRVETALVEGQNNKRRRIIETPRGEKYTVIDE